MKENKFLMVFIAAIIFAQALATAAHAAPAATLDVSLLKYEPQPAEPGSYFDVWFKVDNTGTVVAKNATVTLTPQYPFSTDDNPVVSLGILNPLDSTTIKYRVRVDENAVEGTNNLDLTYSEDPRTSITVSKAFSIDIRTQDAEIGIESATTSPSEFLPGQKGVATIVIKNLADSTLKDITVKLSLSDETTPFAPVDTSVSRKIKTLSGGEISTLTYNLMATPDAASGIYKVPVTMTFSDNVGNSYTSSEIVSLIVGGDPKILTNIEPDETFLSGRTGDVRVNIINRGLVDIKYVTVKVMPTEQFELLSTDEVYIGNIDSDDFDSATFKIHVMPSFSGMLSVPTTISYMSANNKAFEKTENLEMRVYTQGEAQSLGLVGGGGISTTTLLILVVIGYFVYRWYKKRNAK